MGSIPRMLRLLCSAAATWNRASAAGRRPRRTALLFEALEDRFCPSIGPPLQDTAAYRAGGASGFDAPVSSDLTRDGKLDAAEVDWFAGGVDNSGGDGLPGNGDSTLQAPIFSVNRIGFETR
jgi:hypothetical protein